MGEEVTVIQADREAFARMDGWTPGDMGWTTIMSGKDDQCVGVQAFARHRIAYATPATPAAPIGDELVEHILGAGQFLVDRIQDLDWSLSPDDFARDWYGHVDPALARFTNALAAVRGDLP